MNWAKLFAFITSCFEPKFVLESNSTDTTASNPTYNTTFEDIIEIVAENQRHPISLRLVNNATNRVYDNVYEVDTNWTTLKGLKQVCGPKITDDTYKLFNNIDGISTPETHVSMGSTPVEKCILSLTSICKTRAFQNRKKDGFFLFQASYEDYWLKKNQVLDEFATYCPVGIIFGINEDGFSYEYLSKIYIRHKVQYLRFVTIGFKDHVLDDPHALSFDSLRMLSIKSFGWFEEMRTLVSNNINVTAVEAIDVHTKENIVSDLLQRAYQLKKFDYYSRRISGWYYDAADDATVSNLLHKFPKTTLDVKFSNYLNYDGRNTELVTRSFNEFFHGKINLFVHCLYKFGI